MAYVAVVSGQVKYIQEEGRNKVIDLKNLPDAIKQEKNKMENSGYNLTHEELREIEVSCDFF